MTHRPLQLVLLTLAMLQAPSTLAAAEPVATECKKIPGTIEGPMVPTSEVARGIYLAVAKGMDEQIPPSDTIKVTDFGDHWGVFHDSGKFWRGGGMLELRINKCDGSILANYAR